MDRRVHRYPTQSEKSGTSEQVECSEDSSGDHYDPFSPETPIEKVIQWVVEEKIQSHIDYEPWVKTLKDNYITRRLHLSLLERRSLEKLNLPILVESILGNLCSDQVTKTKTKSISKLKMPTTPKAILHTMFSDRLQPDPQETCFEIQQRLFKKLHRLQDPLAGRRDHILWDRRDRKREHLLDLALCP